MGSACNEELHSCLLRLRSLPSASVQNRWKESTVPRAARSRIHGEAEKGEAVSDLSRTWTVFALEAEVDAFGVSRITQTHNAARKRIAELEAENAALRERIAELEKENANQQHDIERLLESLHDEINGGKPCSET